MTDKDTQPANSLTREEILEEAMNVFYAKGVKDLNETELFEGLKISPNAFYSMFRNKEDLLEKAVRHNIKRDREIHEDLRSKSKNAVEELMSLLRHGVNVIKNISPVYINDLVNYYPGIMRIGVQNMQDYTLDLYSTIINRGIKEGLFRSDINIQIVTRVIMENVYVMINYRTFPPEKYSPGEVVRSIYLYYFRGLCRPEGAQIVDEYFSNHSF
ncbi:MAG: TetR/AcrR family transcriptional regulator [Bacteroidota bacterium]